MIELNESVTREMNKYLNGITIEEILLLKRKLFHFQVNFTEEQMNQEIDVLDLSVRAYHCLRRADMHTIGKLVNSTFTKEDATSKRQLLKIRNLGRNSADEILIKLFNYQFMVLPDNKKKAYMDNLLKINFATA